MMKLTFLGLLTALVIIPGFVSGAEIYRVQVGNFKNLKNAENQCQSLRKKIDQAELETWRIEKAGSGYAVRIGQFTQAKPALEMLSRINQTVPDAFLWTGESKEAHLVRLYEATTSKQKRESPPDVNPLQTADPLGSGESKPEIPVPIPQKTPGAELPPSGGNTAQENKNALPENLLEIRRAVLWGTILESRPLSGKSLGLSSAKEIYRVKVRLDRIEPVKGSPNLLEDEGRKEITLFSEVRQSFFLPQQKIKALVEYKGDKYKRFFWIKQVEPLKR
jgi:hypothetical protein